MRFSVKEKLKGHQNYKRINYYLQLYDERIINAFFNVISQCSTVLF